ncbi:MAG: putative sugar O-methyltransferase [Candidatus Sericytochromatia bacterium]
MTDISPTQKTGLYAELKDGPTQISETLYAGRTITSNEVPPPNEAVLVERLMQSFSAAQAALAHVPAPYLVSEEWKRLIAEEWNKYYTFIRENNVAEISSFLRNFFRNEGISGFWGGQNVFDIFAKMPAAEAEFNENLILKQFIVWREHFLYTPTSALAAPPVGNPWGYTFDETLIYLPAMEYHYQARYFQQLLKPVSAPVILEMGGGFGGLAYQILRHIPNAKYLGFDLPENIMIQAYFLSCALPEARVLVFEEGITSIDAECIADYDIVLMPNFVLPKVADKLVDLVLNVRSFSEMAAETISEYFQQFDRIGKRFFFHENLGWPRGDGLFGIPSPDFPVLTHFNKVFSAESRWPRYNKSTSYPCLEELFLHHDAYL